MGFKGCRNLGKDDGMMGVAVQEEDAVLEGDWADAEEGAKTGQGADMSASTRVGFGRINFIMFPSCVLSRSHFAAAV